MVTSGHLLEESVDGTLYHPDMDDSLGSIDDYHAGDWFDVGIVSVSDYEYDVATDSCGSEGWPVDGIVTWDSIKFHQDDPDYELYVQGRSSGRHQGSIEQTWIGSQNHQKAFSVDASKSAKGDSGGPHFRKVTDSYGNEWTYMAGVTVGNTSNDNVGATAVEAVEDYFDVFVDSS